MFVAESSTNILLTWEVSVSYTCGVFVNCSIGRRVV